MFHGRHHLFNASSAFAAELCLAGHFPYDGMRVAAVAHKEPQPTAPTSFTLSKHSVRSVAVMVARCRSSIQYLPR